LINRGQVDYGGGEVGFSQDPSGRGFFGDMAAAANAMGFGPDPSNDPSNDPSSGFTGSVSGVGSPGDEGVGGDGVDYEVGGLIRMAEGGGPPKMTELSAKDLGSTFDISKYIDDEGAWLVACRSLFVMRTARLLGMKAATYHCQFSVT
jgi:hypothetical protein